MQNLTYSQPAYENPSLDFRVFKDQTHFSSLKHQPLSIIGFQESKELTFEEIVLLDLLISIIVAFEDYRQMAAHTL